MLEEVGLFQNVIHKLKPKEREEKKGHDLTYFYSDYWV